MQAVNSPSRDRKLILILDSIQALLIICAVGALGLGFLGRNGPGALPVSFAATGIIVFFFVVARSVGQVVRRSEQDRDATTKACLFGQFGSAELSDESIGQLRGRAVKY